MICRLCGRPADELDEDGYCPGCLELLARESGMTALGEVVSAIWRDRSVEAHRLYSVDKERE